MFSFIASGGIVTRFGEKLVGGIRDSLGDESTLSLTLGMGAGTEQYSLQEECPPDLVEGGSAESVVGVSAWAAHEEAEKAGASLGGHAEAASGRDNATRAAREGQTDSSSHTSTEYLTLSP
ncbi:hypothetical protein E4U36_007940 [Claviceps purpurea]|nr:hypothetical protein E4U36_007940 [Claviceps purpurea]